MPPMIRQRFDPEDFLQEVMMKCPKNASELLRWNNKRFFGWMRMALRNCLCSAIAKHCGRLGTRETVCLDTVVLLLPQEGLLEHLVRYERIQEVAARLLDLPNLDQIALYMKNFDNRDIDGL